MHSISVIRSEFAKGDYSAARMLDHPVYESWQRCSSNKLSMDGGVDYGFLSHQQLGDTLLQHKPLLDSASDPLERLYRSLGGAGWSVLFTDRNCHALRVYPSKNVSEPGIAKAFRQGAVLSEELIGTSAMSCAMASQRFVRVFGQEHYKSFHSSFNCAASPVFDPQGFVCASVDITNEAPNRDNGAFFLLEACARNIQNELIRTLPEAIVVELQVAGNQFGGDSLVLAFGYDQSVTGGNQVSQNFFGLDLRSSRVSFDDLFDEAFAVLFDRGLLRDEPFQLTLRGGIRLFGRVINADEKESTRSYAARASLFDRSESVDIEGDSVPNRSSRFYFGDQRVEAALKSSLNAVARLPVLLLGESGVGKDVMARMIHDASYAGNGAFVSLNCASIPESLIESELFGYDSGAFTGASKTGQMGKIQQADGGTLFLDEIGDMPPALQTRLLRVLETREVIRLGASKPVKVNFQLICATNRDLSAAINSGLFRQDLFYRINGYELQIPALRERADIVGVAQSILDEVAAPGRAFAASARSLIDAYAWPGNVRELRNAIIFADTQTPTGQAIEAKDFPPALQQQITPSVQDFTITYESTVVNGDGQLKNACDDLILKAIDECGGNMTQAAKQLGIGRATLYRKLAKIKH
ncbi:sigma-54-dependent Fis family transcriptional regulator [Marinobacterium mangrovicola]|uniref:GAF modulated Fis family sigma54 specific transcriptional regulator n=1 Tax=Marinobacterium mangrovicola TaxID=1476959 RepID=A0A4R1GIQ6_9GAMM|nr:sigma-54-dependent Fis family transcriptional regulator [Marinobacterium mangrovicola]TCK06993.1 GAF modulated Fis family sigma54 specific transcriptional regulator [Marinobacterium mangrovicola]